MMEETMNMIVDCVKEELGEGYKVRLVEVKKNNGLVLHGVAIAKTGENIAANFYLDDALNDIDSGDISICDVAFDIVNTYMEYSGGKDEISEAFAKIDKNGILAGVTYELINSEMNMERLSHMPHRDFLDLAAIYRVAVCEDESGTAGFVVDNKILEKYGIGVEELDAAAERNTLNKGFVIRALNSIVAALTGLDAADCGSPDFMFVLSNERKKKGAAVMLYNEYFDKIANEVGGDLYVLPSSIDEVIAVPVGLKSGEALRQIVMEVNSSHVAVENFLSNNAYKYIRAENRIVIV